MLTCGVSIFMNQFDVIYSSTLNSLNEGSALPPNLVKTVNSLTDIEHGDLLTAIPLIKKGVNLNDKQQTALTKFLAGISPQQASTQTASLTSKPTTAPTATTQPTTAPVSGSTVTSTTIGA
jgi:hypothetical protein